MEPAAILRARARNHVARRRRDACCTRNMRPSSPSWPELLASFDQLTEDDIAIASDRAPSFDLGALASVAGLRDSRGQVPLDFVVPSRTEVEPTEGMDASAMFFLI